MKAIKRRNVSSPVTPYSSGQRAGSDPSVSSYSLTNSTSSRDTSNSASNTNNGANESSSSPSQGTPKRKYVVGAAMCLSNITNSNCSPPGAEAVPDDEVDDEPISRTDNPSKNGTPRREHSSETKEKRWISVNPNNTTTGEPPPNPSSESNGSELNHLDQLVLGMVQLFLSYYPANDSPSQSTSTTSDSSNTVPAPSTTSSEVSTESNIGSDKIKHELITTLRNTMPLNYLQDVCKKNGVGSIRWFPCTYEKCYNLYFSKGSQRRHTYSHTGERPFNCKFPGCDKSYSASDRLAEHMHSHTNQRPYRCNFTGCPKAYNDPKTLREHKRTHGEKTFTCTIPWCGKSFHRKTHLKQHLRTHNNENSGSFIEPPEHKITTPSLPPLPQPHSLPPPSQIGPSSMNNRSLLNNSTDTHFHVRRSFSPS